MVQIKIFGRTSILENHQDSIVDLVRTEAAQLSGQSTFGVDGIVSFLRRQSPKLLDGDLPGKSYLLISAPNFKTLCERVIVDLCDRLSRRLKQEMAGEELSVEVSEEKNSGIVHGKKLVIGRRETAV